MPFKVSIFGSCASRDGLIFGSGKFRVNANVEHQSLVGFDDPPLYADAAWYSDFESGVRNRFLGDLRKTGRTVLETEGRAGDLLLVDFISEYLDVLHVFQTRVGDHNLLQTAGFRAIYGDVATRTSRFDLKTTEEWERGLRSFLDFAIAKFGEENIVLHEAYMADTSAADQSGSVRRFTPNYYRLIKAGLNDLLSRYYDSFKRLAPRARVICVDEKHRLADPNHRWGFTAFHLVQSYYDSFSEQLIAIAERRSALIDQS